MHEHDKAADLVEKSAALIGALEAENAELREELANYKNAKVNAEAAKLAQAIEEATGAEVDRGVIAKIASSQDEDVKELLQKLSGSREVPAMGRVSEEEDSTKTASELPPEDQQFLSFIMGG